MDIQAELRHWRELCKWRQDVKSHGEMRAAWIGWEGVTVWSLMVTSTKSFKIVRKANEIRVRVLSRVIRKMDFPQTRCETINASI